MDQPRYLQMVRTNQFERVYRRWKEKKLTQAEAAKQLEMSERTFRRYVVRYREGGMGGLLDRRLSKASPRRACAEERSEVVALYRDRYPAAQRKALLRGVRGDPRGRAQLQLGKEPTAGGRGGFEGAASGVAPGV